MHLHHLNMLCKNMKIAKTKLLTLYGFIEYGSFFNSPFFEQSVVLRQCNIYMMLTEDVTSSVDTIDGIAFSVDSVVEYCDEINKYGGILLLKPCIINCSGQVINDTNKTSNCCKCDSLTCSNFVEIAVVKSPLGNVQHTLLNAKSFQGDFLPGFIKNMKDCSSIESSSTLHSIDHIAFAVHQDSAMKYMNWYRNCFKMLPFKISSKETSNGLTIRARGNNGLRMVTLIEHPCSDMALLSKTNQEFELYSEHVKFVFGESLLDEGGDQIQSFLRNHGGEGVQHVAFLSTRILHDTQLWINNGVEFIKPPIGYYNEIRSTLESLRSKIKLDDVYNNCILIDAEKENGKDGYLYQVFAKTILDSDTFFFELIQRDNAIGFGQGNITALWRALDIHTTELMEKESTLPQFIETD